MIDYKQYIRLRTKELSSQLFGIDKLYVRFSRTLKERMAWCDFEKIPPVITYNDEYVKNNKNNKKVLDALIIHEVLHLKYNDDNMIDFKNACKRMGINPKRQPLGVKHMYGKYRSTCTCGWNKRYYHFPRHLRQCPDCFSKDIEIIG